MAASNWWWGDYVDRHFTGLMEVCRLWIRNQTYDDFTVTLVVRMEGDDGKWCAWIRLSPAPLGAANGIEVLVDGDNVPYPLGMVVGRPLERRPGAAAFAVVDYCSGRLFNLEDPDPIEYLPDIHRRNPAVRPRGYDPIRDGVLARELCERHGGSSLHRDDDGIWGFLAPS